LLIKSDGDAEEERKIKHCNNDKSQNKERLETLKDNLIASINDVENLLDNEYKKNEGGQLDLLVYIQGRRHQILGVGVGCRCTGTPTPTPTPNYT